MGKQQQNTNQKSSLLNGKPKEEKVEQSTTPKHGLVLNESEENSIPEVFGMSNQTFKELMISYIQYSFLEDKSNTMTRSLTNWMESDSFKKFNLKLTPNTYLLLGYAFKSALEQMEEFMKEMKKDSPGGFLGHVSEESRHEEPRRNPNHEHGHTLVEIHVKGHGDHRLSANEVETAVDAVRRQLLEQ